MTKIILVNGVINVYENYEIITQKINFSGDFIELTEIDHSKDIIDEVLKSKGDRRILINVSQIQCIKS